MWRFDNEHYQRLAQQYQAAHQAAEPFPHSVIDDFLPIAVCEELLREFPSPQGSAWQHIDKRDHKKLAAQKIAQFGEFTCHVLHELNGPACLGFLETLTGIRGLIPDPYLEGGGLHQIERGGFLKIHADFNKQPHLHLDRRLNLILYLNKDWKDEYNGHLELWERGMKRCARKILPVFNRAVVFNTTDWALHGHPEPLQCPPGRTRKSVALYFYSVGRPAEEMSDSHGVLWNERPNTLSFRGRVLLKLADLADKPGKWMRRKAVPKR
jgi:Rps23 Pro-64 3,4-dihydroxylase Tpa1-like proline 4-hydroxylase